MSTPSRFDETRSARVQKRARLLEKGIDPFPSARRQAIPIERVRAVFDKKRHNATPFRIAGRIIALRVHGGSSFIDLDDGTATLQCLLQRDVLGEDAYATFTDLIDLGDILECRGTAVRTKTNQETLRVNEYRLLAKSMTPLPEKFHGLADEELRARSRHLDLLANPESKKRFIARSNMVAAMRSVMEKNNFLEVETPVLQPIPGGAAAEPFRTHHKDLDRDLSLRIAPELYLKRCIVGGLPRVFEVARCFRNESIDHDHNPEFTQIEAYAAYWDDEAMMSFVEKLCASAVTAATGSTDVSCGKTTLAFASPLPRVDFRKIVQKQSGIDLDAFPDAKALTAEARTRGVNVETDLGRGKVIDRIFKATVRPGIIQPTFIVHHPVELSALAKRSDKDTRVAARFQLLVNGTECANGFTELNDPDEQLERFREQEKLRNAGDAEAERIDEDYVEALRTGMPPTAGVGIGIDRLAAIITCAKNLKDVILFPMLRERGSSKEVNTP